MGDDQSGNMRGRENDPMEGGMSSGDARRMGSTLGTPSGDTGERDTRGGTSAGPDATMRGDGTNRYDTLTDTNAAASGATGDANAIGPRSGASGQNDAMGGIPSGGTGGSVGGLGREATGAGRGTGGSGTLTAGDESDLAGGGGPGNMGGTMPGADDTMQGGGTSSMDDVSASDLRGALGGGSTSDDDTARG